MLRKGMTIQDAAEHWIHQFNAVPTGMIEKLMQFDREDWHEITPPTCGDRVYVDKFKPESPRRYGPGVLHRIKGERYTVNLDDGSQVTCSRDEIEATYDDRVPMWGTMWSFGERMDDDWLEGSGGFQAMARCGFRIFESEEFGYFFGIDGAGYDFYTAHWIPLYKARGLEWHDPETEKAVG